MNAPTIHQSILRRHLATVEASHALTFLGILPDGLAGHVASDCGIAFLAEKRAGLDLLGLCEAEAMLADLLGRPVGIILKSAMTEPDAQAVTERLDPL
jgi:hypothetical protein